MEIDIYDIFSTFHHQTFWQVIQKKPNPNQPHIKIHKKLPQIYTNHSPSPTFLTLHPNIQAVRQGPESLGARYKNST